MINNLRHRANLVVELRRDERGASLKRARHVTDRRGRRRVRAVPAQHGKRERVPRVFGAQHKVEQDALAVAKRNAPVVGYSREEGFVC